MLPMTVTSPKPLDQYTTGTYFTYNENACTTHSGCTWNTPCNCINVNNSIWCLAYANNNRKFGDYYKK